MTCYYSYSFMCAILAELVSSFLAGVYVQKCTNVKLYSEETIII